MKHFFIFTALNVLLISQSWGLDSFTSADSAWGKKHFITGVADYWKYEEFPDIMKDSGGLLGFNYAFKNNVSQFYYEVNVEGLYGQTTYEGHTMSNNTAISFNQTNLIYMGQAWVGLQIQASSSVFIIPKVGYLYRKLIDFNDDVGGDYRREQQYYVIPVGVDVIVRMPVGQMAFTTWLSADFRGQNKTFLTDAGGDRDVGFKQDKGYGLHLEGNYMYDMFILGGFVRYWKLDKSNNQFAVLPAPTGAGTFTEPENETISIGIKGGVTF